MNLKTPRFRKLNMTTLTELKSNKPVQINMKVNLKQRELIDTAAAILSVDRTSFILDAACKRAEEVILDRRLFLLGDEAFDRFEQALDADPIRSNECVKRLLVKPKPWS